MELLTLGILELSGLIPGGEVFYSTLAPQIVF